jgi:hypothetical protein
MVCSSLFQRLVSSASDADINALSAQFTTPKPDAASGSAASFPIIPIAAAAGGGILLLVIVVIVLVRRRRDPQKTKTPRNVVAFENPMYDNAGKDPVYNSIGGGHDGLYDEPAAMQPRGSKENPMYDSSENLAGGNDEFNKVAAHLKKEALPDDYLQADQADAAKTMYGDDYLTGDAVGMDLNDPATAKDAAKGGHDGLLEQEPDQGDGDGYLDVTESS